MSVVGGAVEETWGVETEVSAVDLERVKGAAMVEEDIAASEEGLGRFASGEAVGEGAVWFGSGAFCCGGVDERGFVILLRRGGRRREWRIQVFKLKEQSHGL